MTKHKKILKPIEIDAHFKYRCPKCSYDHWISLNEARTKDFKIVCDCKKVFSPRRIAKLQIVYISSKKKPEEQPQTTAEIPVQKQTIHTQEKEPINHDLLYKCLSVLIGYGFTKTEAQNMINKAYEIDHSNDCGQLVKLALKSLGVDKT